MTRKTWIKIGMVMVITGVLCFSDFGFAAETGVKYEEKIAILLNFIVSVLSWIWVLFAKIAGELLTNKWVYGGIIGLDKLLWRYRVIVKNIANFGLGFYFIYTIFLAFISKEDIGKRVKDIIIWLLIGGVGIQASRFFTAAMIDVSTITLSAVGSLPSHILANNSVMQEDMRLSLSKFVDQNFTVTSGTDYILFPNDGNNSSFFKNPSAPIVGDVTKENFIDMLMPNSDDVSGPLYYIGFAILKTDKVGNLDLSSLKGIKKTILNTIIVGGTTIVYSIEMFVLCVLALMRMLYLRMFVVLSPFAILFRCIGKADKKTGDKLGGFLGSITKQLNFKAFFLNIFKPTIIVLGMGIAMIFTVLMSGVVNESGNTVDKDLGGIHITSKQDGDIYDTTISSDFFNYSIKSVAKGLLDFIISVFTVILMYFIIKIAVGIGKGDDFVSKGISKIQDNVHGAITSMPIVPVAGYDENGVPTQRHLSLKGITEFPSRKLSNMSASATALTAQQTDDVLAGLGLIDNNMLTEGQKQVITRIRTSGNYRGLDILMQQKNEIDKIKTKEGKGMMLNPNASDQYWRNEFTSWLNDTRPGDVTNDTWKAIVKAWQTNSDKDKRDMKELFGNPQFAKAYANLFGYTGTYANFGDIMNLDISQKH